MREDGLQFLVVIVVLEAEEEEEKEAMEVLMMMMSNLQEAIVYMEILVMEKSNGLVYWFVLGGF